MTAGKQAACPTERGETMTSTLTTATAAAIDRLEVAAYTIPTDAPEADGTYSWDKTTLVLVEVASGDEHGLGYTYALQC
jgi:hypothetical protein